jgi:hypothetical protein
VKALVLQHCPLTGMLLMFSLSHKLTTPSPSSAHTGPADSCRPRIHEDEGMQKDPCDAVAPRCKASDEIAIMRESISHRIMLEDGSSLSGRDLRFCEVQRQSVV